MKLIAALLFLIVCQPILAFSSSGLVVERMDEAKNSDENALSGELFLNENLRKKGVKETKSGLQYEVLKEGKTGMKPKNTDVVNIHYRGTLADGTVFEETYSSGRPTRIYIDKAFAGWAEGLQLMEVGSEFRLFIPPALAYGKKKIGTKIKPNSVLIFEIELLEIVDRKKLEENKTSPINPSSVDLSSPPKSAKSFLTLLTNVIPAFTEKDIMYTCEAIAADIYMEGCQSFFEKRLLVLQKISIAKASFDNKYISEAGAQNNDISISWREQFELVGGKNIVANEKIKLLFLNQNGQWRIKSATEENK